MFNEKSIETVNKAYFKKPFKKPLYNSYCFSNIPNTILNNFGVNKKGLPIDCLGNDSKEYKKVILFLLDGFGWNLFEKYYKQSVFLQKGFASKLTSLFPSTTTSCITTIHTSVPLVQSGISEWFMYEPKIDDIYSPLLFKTAGDNLNVEIDASEILPQENIYTRLLKQDVKSYVFQYELFNEGKYSKHIQKNSQVVGFKTLKEGLERLKDITKIDEKAYCYFYHADIDKLCHEFGPNSKEAEREILNTLALLERFMNEVNMDDTMVIVTADHGLTTVKPERVFYVNKEVPNITDYLKLKKNNQPIVPCGSFRDMFLHVKEEKLDELYNILQDRLKEKAFVFKVS